MPKAAINDGAGKRSTDLPVFQAMYADHIDTCDCASST